MLLESTQRNISESFGQRIVKALLEPRIWMIFLLGICSGFPWVLIGSAMTGWLTDSELSRTAIGLFGSIFFAYTINFLWAPLIDRFSLPFSNTLGQRKTWIITMLLLMAVACFYMRLINPQTSIWMLSVVAMSIAIFSATQDIAIDAFRVDVIEKSEVDFIPFAAAAATSGWWTGYSLVGAAAFFMKGLTGLEWASIYFFLSGFCIVMAILVVAFVREKKVDRNLIYQEIAQLGEGDVLSHIKATLISPFLDLIKRHGFWLIVLLLSFLFTFKMGEAFLGRMSITFYKEVGFTDVQIANYSKMVTWVVTILFSILGAIVNMRLGIFKGLMIGGVAMAATNLMFAWIANVGPDEELFLLAVILDGFTSAFATVVIVSFITHLTSQNFSASQYALLASVANFGKTTVASSSGWVVDMLAKSELTLVDALGGEWSSFFVLTTVMVIPSLLILVALFKLIKE